jgi:hypothetical protein
MSSKTISMHSGNKGLTVKINLWALEKYIEGFDSKSARLWIRGQATHADTGKAVKFNDAGELISILGKWNAAKFRDLRKKTHST